MTRLLLWRHGRTTWNATDRVQGQSDVELDETGVTQARLAAPLLAALRPDLIVSSDLRRAADTAAALAALTGLEISHDARLRERHFGSWQGLTMGEIAERFPDDHRRSRAGEPVTDLTIEPVEALRTRVTAALRDVVARVGGGTAVVVTHGGAARSGTAGILDWPMAALTTLGGLDNCHFTELRHSPSRGWQLRAHNVGPAVIVEQGGATPTDRDHRDAQPSAAR